MTRTRNARRVRGRGIKRVQNQLEQRSLRLAHPVGLPMNQVRLQSGPDLLEGEESRLKGAGKSQKALVSPRQALANPQKEIRKKEVAEDPLEIKGSLQAIMPGNKLDSRTTDLINDQKIKIWLVAMLIYSGCILFRSRM